MAHHSGQDSEETRKLLSEMFPYRDQLGATGKFPLGKLAPSDEGETRIAIGSKDGKVVMDFGKPTVWIGFTPEQARDIAETILKHAKAAALGQ